MRLLLLEPNTQGQAVHNSPACMQAYLNHSTADNQQTVDISIQHAMPMHTNPGGTWMRFCDVHR